MITDVSVIAKLQKVLNECNCKTNKIWLDKGRIFYKAWMISWWQDNDIGMYSRHNEYLLRISKYKNVSAKDYTPNWSNECLWLKKLKILFRERM